MSGLSRYLHFIMSRLSCHKLAESLTLRAMLCKYIHLEGCTTLHLIIVECSKNCQLEDRWSWVCAQMIALSCTRRSRCLQWFSCLPVWWVVPAWEAREHSERLYHDPLRQIQHLVRRTWTTSYNVRVFLWQLQVEVGLFHACFKTK